MTDKTTETRILRAAGAIFAEQGFEKATIREICRQAEVNLASVNYHFGDKQRLYRESIKYAHLYRMRQVPVPNWAPEVRPETKLREFIQTTMSWLLVVEGLPWQHKLMVREMLQPTGACKEVVEDLMRPHFELLLGILDELVPSLPSPRRHLLAFSVLGKCMFYRFNDQAIQTLIPGDELAEHFVPHKIADHIADLVLAALGFPALENQSARCATAATSQTINAATSLEAQA